MLKRLLSPFLLLLLILAGCQAPQENLPQSKLQP